MRQRSIVSLVFLFAILVELFDPSTNFIRRGSDIGKNTCSLIVAFHSDHQDHNSSNPPNDDDDQNHRSLNFQDTNICYATAVSAFEFLGSDIILDLFMRYSSQEYTDTFCPSIFRPPINA